jgi:hypothetical protein
MPVSKLPVALWEITSKSMHTSYMQRYRPNLGLLTLKKQQQSVLFQQLHEYINPP